MTLVDWLRETRSEFRGHPPRSALRQSVDELWIGGLRRINRFADPGTPHWELDFDVLCILDACRVDLMREVCAQEAFEWLPEPDNVDSIRSLNSSSLQWMDGMFGPDSEDTMARTAYITGNLFAERLSAEAFALYDVVEPRDVDGVHTVPPRPLTDRAIEVWRRRDDFNVDQVVVHYMQPHTPFRARPRWFDPRRENRTSWGEGFARLRDGDLDREKFWEAYRDNLNWVLEDVETLLENCNGNVVLSADHGNGFGEWGVYGHPSDVPVSSVRNVPVVTLEGVDQRTHEPAIDRETFSRSDIDREVTKEHLRSMGYIE